VNPVEQFVVLVDRWQGFCAASFQKLSRLSLSLIAGFRTSLTAGTFRSGKQMPTVLLCSLNLPLIGASKGTPGHENPQGGTKIRKLGWDKMYFFLFQGKISALCVDVYV